MTPVPAHSRHLAGSTATGTATGEEAAASAAPPSSSAAAAEALEEGADSAAASAERPNAPAASAAARREVEGAGDAPAAAAPLVVAVVVEGIPGVSCCHRRLRACVSAEEGKEEKRRTGERIETGATAASKTSKRKTKNSPSSSPVLEAWAATGLLLEAKRPRRRGAGATAVAPAPRHEGQTW